MGRLQDVARFLLAAGGSASADGESTHLFHEVKNSLFMETWKNSELKDRVQVVTGVRSDTSAPLVNLHYKRIFVVDQTHTLKCFTETSNAEHEGDDDDEEEEEEEDSHWEHEELDDLHIRVHEKSQLTVACGEFTIVVFYQSPDGTIGAIEDDGSHDGWKIAQLPNCEALPGTPMASFQAKDTVYFVYVAADQSVRYLEHSNNEWKDAPFSSAKIDGASAKISLAEDEKAETDPKLLIFCLADKKLSTIKPGSTEAETWGTVEDGVYKPTSDQENNGSPHGSIPNPFHPGHLFIYSSGPPPPQLPATVPVPVPVPFPVAPFACYEDFRQLSLRDHAVEYQQPPPYDYPHGRFDERFYDPHDEAFLRQSAQLHDPRVVQQTPRNYDPSWQPPYQHPYRARDMYQRDPYYQDGYPPDRYPQDYYQRDPHQRDPYERGPYHRDPNQPPPQEFSRSQQQDPLQGVPRQQQGPLQESSRQQQQQQQQQEQQQPQPPTQEPQPRQQAPLQEARQQEPVHRPPTVEDVEEEDDDDDDSSTRPRVGTERPRAPQPNHEETQQQQQRPQGQQRQQQRQRPQQQQQRRAISPTVDLEDEDEALLRRRPQTRGSRARQAFLDEHAERQTPRRRTPVDSPFDADEDAFLQQFRRHRQEVFERHHQDELRHALHEEQRARRPPPQHRGFYEPHRPYWGHGYEDHHSAYRPRTRPDPIIKFRTYHYITSMRCERCNRRYRKVNRGLPFGRSHEWVKKCRC